MELIYSEKVLNTIAQYADALTRYPISNDRIRAKVDNMFSALQSISTNPLMYPVCKYRVLGQSLDGAGNPKNPFLRQFVYKDESGKSWTFSYLINRPLQKVLVTNMMYSAFVVRESPEIRKILSLMERMANLN